MVLGSAGKDYHPHPQCDRPGCETQERMMRRVLHNITLFLLFTFKIKLYILISDFSIPQIKHLMSVKQLQDQSVLDKNNIFCNLMVVICLF